MEITEITTWVEDSLLHSSVILGKFPKFLELLFLHCASLMRLKRVLANWYMYIVDSHKLDFSCFFVYGTWHWRLHQFSSVQFSRSVVSDSLWPHELQHNRPSCPSPTPGVHSNSRLSNWWCHPAVSPLSYPSPSAPNPSQHQNLFKEPTLHMRWPKYWSFSFSITPYKEHPGLISFRMDWLDLLAVQGTFKSLLQNHS